MNLEVRGATVRLVTPGVGTPVDLSLSRQGHSTRLRTTKLSLAVCANLVGLRCRGFDQMCRIVLFCMRRLR